MFHRGFKHSKTIKALGLRPRAFISFLVFETPMKHSHSFLKYYAKISCNGGRSVTKNLRAGQDCMRTSLKTDFHQKNETSARLKITFVDMTYPGQRPELLSLSRHFLLMYIIRVVLANLRRRPLKLGRLIVLLERHLKL